MRIISLLFFFAGLSINLLNAQSSKTQERMLWNMDSLPTWEDYKGKVPRSATGAGTMSGLEVRAYAEDGMQKILVGAFFYPQKSYVNADSQTESLYDHEIIHFHITELYTRMLRKQIFELGKKDLKKVQDRLQEMVQSTMDRIQKEQDRYDKETSSSMNYSKQKEWKADILAQLQALKEYENAVLEFPY